MIPILLGANKETRKRVYLDPDLFCTHFHLVGATGTGKSTALLTMLRPLLTEPCDKCCLFLIDPIGNLSRDLLRFIAHPTYCPEHVRQRLLYIEPANEEHVITFNPLTHVSEGSRYYQTMRAVDIVLRAWAAQDVTQQPRLLQWTYKAFCAAAMMGLPIAMCRYLLHPGTDEHNAILARIPGDIRTHWQRIIASRGEAERILESTRNRLDPFFESANLRRMFGSQRSLFDCERLIRERRVVILNLGKFGKIPGFVADTIGALLLNEIFETASRLSTTKGRAAVDPTYVVMDEFQKYVGLDIEDALPTVRQMGLRLVLAHQSFSQLEREDVDLTQMIWQARSRLMFANSARDADIIADELAKLSFDPMTVKDVRKSLKQLIIGYRKEWLESESSQKGRTDGDTQQKTIGYTNQSGESTAPGKSRPTSNRGHGEQDSQASGRTATQSSGQTQGRSQANVPIHKTIEETSSITFESFDEFALKWGQKIRRLRTGESIATFSGDDTIHEIVVDHLPIKESKQMQARVDELLARNYASEFFITAAEADREQDECRRRLLLPPPIQLSPPQDDSRPKPPKEPLDPPESPFR